VNGHKIHDLGFDQLRSTDEITLVLTVFVIDNYYEFSAANVFSGILDRSKGHVQK